MAYIAGGAPTRTAKTRSGLTPLLDMDVGQAFEDQYVITEKRQQKETEKTIRDQGVDNAALREADVINREASAAAGEVQRRQMEVLGRIDQQLEKANRAMELTDSDNPMDRLTLWMLQQTDPAYTKDGNQRRIDYLNSVASTIGAYGQVQQGDYSRRISDVQNRAEMAKLEGADELTLLKMQEAQGAERIQMANDAMAALAGNLQNQVSMQQNALAQLPDEGVEAALVEAQKNGSANVGGVEVSAGVLQTRKQQIDERNFLSVQRDQTLQGIALDAMTAEDVTTAMNQAASDDTGYFVTDTGVRIPLSKLQERSAALTNQQYVQTVQSRGIENMEDERRREIDRKLLERGYNVFELKEMQRNGFKDKTGRQFDADQVEAAIQHLEPGQQTASAIELLQAQGAMSEKAAVDHSNYLNSLKITPGSQLAQMVDGQKRITALAAAKLGDPNTPPEVMIDMQQVLAGSRQTVDEAIKNEALRLAGGDKDVAILQEAAIRQQPVAPEVLDTILLERGKAMKPMTPFLDADLNGVWRLAFDQAKQQIDADLTGFGSMSAAEKNEAAAQAALSAVKSAATGGLMETIMAQQAVYPGNPLQAAGISPEKFLVMAHGAEQAAAIRFMQDNGLTQDQLDQHIRNGDNPALIQSQLASTLAALDQVKPGLGKAYMDWWTSTDNNKGNGYVLQFMDRQSSQQDGSRAMARWSLVAPDLPGQMQVYGESLQQAFQTQVGADLVRMQSDYVNFGGNTRLKQAYLVQNTPELSDSEKQIAMTILDPIIRQADGLPNATPTQKSQFIEGRLRMLQPPAGDSARVWKKFLAGRENALRSAESWIDAQQMNPLVRVLSGMNPGLFMSGQTGQQKNQADSFKQEITTMQWFQKMSELPK